MLIFGASMKTIRIGNGQGFWGDNVDAPVELLRGGPIDYIGMDYLAEVTLSIMMRQKLKNPSSAMPRTSSASSAGCCPNSKSATSASSPMRGA
jgi:Acyclic terpene utilisation family protein AtuA